MVEIFYNPKAVVPDPAKGSMYGGAPRITSTIPSYLFFQGYFFMLFWYFHFFFGNQDGFFEI